MWMAHLWGIGRIPHCRGPQILFLTWIKKNSYSNSLSKQFVRIYDQSVDWFSKFSLNNFSRPQYVGPKYIFGVNFGEQVQCLDVIELAADIDIQTFSKNQCFNFRVLYPSIWECPPKTSDVICRLFLFPTGNERWNTKRSEMLPRGVFQGESCTVR